MSKKKHHPNTLQEKKSKFQQQGRSKHTVRIALVLASCLLLAVVIYMVYDAGNSRGSEIAVGTSPGEDLKIPISDVSEGQAKFYRYKLPTNQEIKFFVIKSSDGIIRAAFDACDVCFKSRRGYHQEGDEMVCNNCQRRFPSASVNVITGGCNPGALARIVEGDHLVIKAADLAAGVHYF